MISISIITINLNNAKGLKKTFDSIFCQNFKNFEYIVIDGGSTDGSLNLIQNNIKNIVFWVSEKDNGIYSAMNKGLNQAKGKYVLFLNSGDELFDEKALEVIDFNQISQDFIYFDVQFIGANEKYYHTYPDNLDFNYFLKYSLPHQATLIKRELFYRFGNYNETFKICSDWEFFILAIIKNNASYLHIKNIFSKMYRDGTSCNSQNIKIIQFEKKKVLKKHFSIYLVNYIKTKELIQKSLIYYLFKKISFIKINSF